MKFDRLVTLLPCQSLEDFDLGRKEEDAEQLLSAWSVLWHPALLTSAQALPTWHPAASPPQDPSGYLVIVPDCCKTSVPEDWFLSAEAVGACILLNLRNRQEMLAAAIKRLDVDLTALDPSIEADFLALGYCHLQVELITRKLRYMSNLNEALLQKAALAAAQEALDGNASAARQNLQSAFDRLHEARECYYPIEARLIDLTLVALTTLGASLREELVGRSVKGDSPIFMSTKTGTTPCNLLASGGVIEEMAQREPETLETLKQALADHTAALIGGEYAEAPLPLLGPEAIGRNLARGLDAYRRCLQQSPAVFGRRRFGLTPALPQLLDRLGFTGAYHCTLDDGRFPAGNQSRIQWEGFDGSTIESLARVPLDAGRPESFLRLAEKLGGVMNLDYAAAVVFAHWPGRSSPWYNDLRRIAAYGSVLGSFVTITDYFEQTSLAGHRNHYKPDDYRSPYLKQDATAGRSDPISRWVRYFHRMAKLESLESLTMLSEICGETIKKGEGGRRKREGETSGIADELASAIDDSLNEIAENDERFDVELETKLRKSLVGFASLLIGGATSTKRGLLLINPCSFSQQANLHPSSFIPHPLCVDVPAMGFAWVDPSDPKPDGDWSIFRQKKDILEKTSAENMDLSPSAAPVKRKGWFGIGNRKRQEPPPLAEENVLRNEFFEVRFDPSTGTIRSIRDYQGRDPRLAQQIALRLPRGGEPDSEMNYSIMSADELSVTSSGPVMGEMVCRGRLMDHEGRRVAGFRQTTRAWRGSRVLELAIELDIDRQPGPNPWDSYYAVRFAWKDETAGLYRSVNLANLPTELTQIESPHFLDIRRDKQRTTLLCGGLPYHRRFGPRKLDTLLVVQGETARSFRLGIGIDVPHPMSAALGFLSPPLMLPDQPPPPTTSGWLFHLDCRNVLATHWEPLSAGGNGPDGFRIRLLETDGLGVQLGLRSFRAVASASKINPGDVPPVMLEVAGDRLNIPIGPHQWIEVEVLFQYP